MPRSSREKEDRRASPYNSSRDRGSHYRKHRDHRPDDDQYKRKELNRHVDKYSSEDVQKPVREYERRRKNDHSDIRNKDSSRRYKYDRDGGKKQRHRSLSPSESDPSAMMPNMLSSGISQVNLFGSASHFPVQSITQQATRHACGVYVGGLPPLANEQTISKFFSHVMALVGGNSAGPGDAVMNVYINHEKKFAFVEMRTVEEASNAMALDGVVFEGVSLRIRRPTDYNPSLAAVLGPSQPSAHLNLAAAGITPGIMGNILQIIRNRGEGGEDRISNLPECVMGNILSRLPSLEEAVRTSVLSTDWKYKWTSVHKVKINDFNILVCKPSSRTLRKDASFVKFVDSVLTLSKNATSFDLCFFINYHLLTPWISKVLDRIPSNIHTFRLTISPASRRLVLPQTLLNCTKLENLELSGDFTLNIPVRVNCFPNLITLHLREIKIVNESSDTLILDFPVLKSCIFTICDWLNVKLIEIHAPSMTTFSSNTPFNHPGVDKYMIKIFGRSLTSFESCGGLPEDYFISTRSTIVSAAIHNYNRAKLDENVVAQSGPKTRSLISGFSNLEELKLSDHMAKAIAQSKREHALPQYNKLKRLVILGLTLYPFEWSSDALFELLHAAPSLKFLGIHEIDWDGYDLDYSAQSIPWCIVRHLEEVEFKYRSYDDKHQFHLEKFLLKNGLRLKKFSIYVGDGMRKCKIVKRLSAFSRGSKCLTIRAP